MDEMKINYYVDGGIYNTGKKETDIVKEITFKELYEIIKSDKYKEITLRTNQLYNIWLQTKEKADFEKYTKEKKNCDYITYGGTFTNRENEALTKYSGVMVFDIDKSNEKQLAKVKTDFKDIPGIFLIHRSPSKHGIKVYLQSKYDGQDPIAFHKQLFECFTKEHHKLFDSEEIKLDKLKDISRACFICYDDHVWAAFDKMNEPYTFDYVINRIVPKVNFDNFENKNFDYTFYNENHSPEHSINLIEQIIKYFDDKNIETKGDFLQLMYGIKTTFGEEGKEYFMRMRKHSKSCDIIKNAESYDKCKINENAENKVTMGTIVYMAKKYGYELIRNEHTTNFNLIRNTQIYELIENDVKLRYNETTMIKQIYDNQHKVWRNIDDVDEAYIIDKIMQNNITREAWNNLCMNISPKIRIEQEFLKEIPVWDGKSNIQSLFETLTTDNPELYSILFRKWAISFIAQLHNTPYITQYDRIARNELMLILSGKQYIGKSNWLRKLLPIKWHEMYSPKNIELNEKDDRIAPSENFIISFEEGVSMRKQDQNKLKTLMSSSKTNERKAYGHNNANFYRICSFCATINEGEILNDPTGSRRYIVIKCDKINDKHNIDQWQVWAEAYEAYKNNEQYWLTDEEVTLLQHKNEIHEVEYEEDLWIKKSFYSYDHEGEKTLMNNSEILEYLRNRNYDVRKATTSSIGARLRHLGYNKKEYRIQGKGTKNGFMMCKKWDDVLNHTFKDDDEIYNDDCF